MSLLKPRKTITVEKLFKVLQNRHIIELFKFFGWTTTSLCGNLGQPKPKTDTKLYKISQNRPMVVNFLIFPAHPSPWRAPPLTPYSDNEFTKNTIENLIWVKTTYFKGKGKRCREVILGQKWHKNTSPRWRRKILNKRWSFSKKKN